MTVTLSNGGETGAQVSGPSSTYRAMGTQSQSGPFTTTQIPLRVDVQNKDLRCQALDNNGNLILGVRTPNLDTTFSGAGKKDPGLSDNQAMSARWSATLPL